MNKKANNCGGDSEKYTKNHHRQKDEEEPNHLLAPDAANNDETKQRQNFNELTAEWTVRAHLTISGPGEKVSKEFSTNDPDNPVRVTCKWTNLDDAEKANEQFTDSGQCSPQKGQTESFHSTNSTFGDLGDSIYSNKSPSKSPRNEMTTRCHTTCNIILSAVADFPCGNDFNEKSKPNIIKTTATCTSNNHHIRSKSCDLRDAYSQTSDTESKKAAFDDLFLNKIKTNQRVYGQQRRYTTDSLLCPEDYVDGDHILSPRSGTITPPFSRVPPLPDEILSNEPGKKSRTVHIDVYCTGSETDDADVENSSISSDGIRMELDSNSTPQTVLNNEEMMIHHMKVNTREKLPRRFLRNNQPEKSGGPKSPIDEILESKKMLLRKHMGTEQIPSPVVNNRKSRPLFKNPSDDYVSSGYAHSIRSNHDHTNSSVSSNVPSHEIESSWKETDHEFNTMRSINKSDSFEYDNIRDRIRIQQMEKYWGKSDKDQEANVIMSHHLPNHHLKPIAENRTSLTRNDTLPSECGTDIFLTIDTTPERDSFRKISPDFFLTDDTSKSPSHSPITVRPSTLERWKSQAQETLVTSSVPQTPSSPTIQRSFSQRWNRKSPPKAKPTNIEFTNSRGASVASTILSNISGYTNEYLERASKFGAVVTTTKKPGHHVGPTKNPNCQCEHCQRWLSTRFVVAGRGRAYSVGDAPGGGRGKFIINRN